MEKLKFFFFIICAMYKTIDFNLNKRCVSLSILRSPEKNSNFASDFNLQMRIFSSILQRRKKLKFCTRVDKTSDFNLQTKTTGKTTTCQKFHPSLNFRMYNRIHDTMESNRI